MGCFKYFRSIEWIAEVSRIRFCSFVHVVTGNDSKFKIFGHNVENSNVKRLKEVCYVITICLTLLVPTPSAKSGGGVEPLSYLRNDKCYILRHTLGGVSFKVSKNFKFI